MYLRLALAEFCRETRAYRWPAIKLPLIQGIAEYTFPLSEFGRVYAMASITYQGRPLEHLTPERLNARSPNWESETGRVYAYHLFGVNKIRFVRIPTETEVQAITCRPILVTTRATAQVSEDFADEWVETVAKLTAVKLMGLADQTWQNPKQAALLSQQLDMELLQIKTEAEQDHHFKDGLVQYGGY